MNRNSSMFNKSWMLPLVLAGSLFVVNCGDDNNNPSNPGGGNTNRTYVQIERLGNPLVSEVLFPKRNHGFHNATGPQTDVANFTDDVQDFVFNVAGRDTAVATTLSSVLLPDMLVVYTDRAASGAGWLTWALTSGYGGRKLSDDVVDGGLSALFGTLLDPNDVTACLASDNVDANDVAFDTSFPYLAAPH